ncbi:ubiquitin carboxyl-terminal hydrolase [Nesidiocoris tenuis]|uniref:Ubiquitin carboxyl-terminal hydrolase n=1 Tax=Nesidiocoris tenuis TaxID=355587 RepID=A0ABN7AYZ6_9HEMI|nr:ubiquitin carboxyl-terminal hydrolase [Nesidiocoris tenuis]
MTITTGGQTVEPPDGENNIVPAQQTPVRAPDAQPPLVAAPPTEPNPVPRIPPGFPLSRLKSLDEKISSQRWVVPVLPDQELELLIQAAIDLSRTGDDMHVAACQRFYREGLTISFTKILTDEAVNSWKFNIHQCIYQNCLKLVELCVVKLNDDSFLLLDLLAMLFNPNNRYHTYNASRRSDSVPVDSTVAEEEIFAWPHDSHSPRGWLVDLINRFGTLGGFQILVERFAPGKDVPVPIMHALIRPFGSCYDLLTVHTIEKYLMPIVERVPLLLENLTDEELKKETKNESKNDVISSIIKSAKCLATRVSGQVETIKQLEIFKLKMILRLLQISSFNGKMNALNEVNKIISSVSCYPHRPTPANSEPDGEWLTPGRMAKWIKENGVLQIVLRDSLHQPQYVEKLEKILRFVIKEKCLSLEDLDILWAAQHGKHEAIVKNVHDLLAKLAWDFSPEQLDHLFGCYQSSWTSANKKQREKLLELIRRLAEDDKNGVMAHKVLSLFWNLAHSDEVVTEIVEQALCAHVKILDYSCSQDRDAQKTAWLNRCVEELNSNENWVLPALKLIRDIACLYETPPNANQRSHQVCNRQEVINKLQGDHQLVILVSNNLTDYINRTRNVVAENPNIDPNEYYPDKRFNHISQVQERLNFLKFLLKDGQLWLCAEQAKQIWTCLAEGAVFQSDREACFKWFSKLMGDEPDLDPAINKDFFINNILQLDPSLLTESGMRCFERFFKAVNSKEGKLRMKKRIFLMDDVDLIGNEYIWRVITSGSDDMAARAIQLLKEVTTNLGPRLQSNTVNFHKNYICECLDRLRAHYDTVNLLRDSGPSDYHSVQQECIKMCRVLKVLKEYISEYDGEYSGDRSKLPLYRACRGKQMTLIVRFAHPGRMTDDIEISTHGNETIGMARRHIIRRLKSVPSQHVKIDLFFNGELLDPAEDRKLLSDLIFADKILLNGKFCQANTNVSSSPDSSSDSSTSSPQHPYEPPNVAAEISLPGVLLTDDHHRTMSLLKVCDLASKLKNTALAQVAYSVLNLCPPDSETYVRMLRLFSGARDDRPQAEMVSSEPTNSTDTINSILYESPSPQILYNLEVLYSILMPANEPHSDKAFECQFNFFESPNSMALLDILTKENFMPNADVICKRHAYLTVLKICKLMLCTVGHILYICGENSLQMDNSSNSTPNNVIVLKQALCSIPSPTTETVVRSVSVKVAKAYVEKYGFENKWTKWLPSKAMVDSLTQLAWACACADIKMVGSTYEEYDSVIPQANPHLFDILVCKEALEVLTIALVLHPETLDALLNDNDFQTFIIDLVLLSNCRTVRMVAAEQFLHMVSYRNSHELLQFAVLYLFCVINKHVVDHAKNSHEYFQLLCGLLNFMYLYNCPLPTAEKLLVNEIEWLRTTRELVKEMGSDVEDALVEGHLGIAKELFSFVSPEMKYKFGSHEEAGGTLIKELVEDFIFPASKMMLHLQKTGELIPEQSASVCCSPSSLCSAYELLVTLCNNCKPNMRILVSMLTDMFYSADNDEGLQEWDYLPPIGPRPPSGFVGLKNAGATCYMNSVLQQLFMVPSIRQGVLAADGAIGDNEEFHNDTYSIMSVNCEQEEKASSEESRKEYNIGILKQVQAIFGHLAYSKLQYYVPKGLWKHFKLQGEPVNLREQQDAVEFFMSLIESIDDALKALTQEQIMSKILGGSFSDQKICKGCPHRYSKEEPFSVISVDIRNQSTLQDSLEQYVKGELLEGADAYHCEKCNKKVVTVKRLCVKKLPPILTIQLKRFEYDFERVCAIKFNDYFEFPRVLDMEPYTVSGLAKLEGEMDCEVADGSKEPTTKYNLTGIIVHSGQASGGHYYSYVLHRSYADGTLKWYKFDDGEVTECKMESDEEMKSQCFGGEYMGEVFDHMMKRMTYKRQKRWWNAYMLYYTRQDGEEGDLVKSVNQLSLHPRSNGIMKMPAAIERSVCRQNISFMHTRNQFSPEYFQFMRRLATCTIPPANRLHNADKPSPDAEELSLLSVQIFSRFLFHTGFHTKKCLRGPAADWYEPLLYHLKAFSSVRSWFAHNILFKHPNRFCEYLLSCPTTEVRITFMKIIVFLAHYSLHDGPCPPPLVNSPTILLDPMATMSDHLLQAVLSMLNKEVSEHGRHLVHYFSLFHMYACLGIEEKTQLLKLNVPATFMMVAMDEGPGPAIKYTFPEFTKLHCVVSQLIRCCDLSARTTSFIPSEQPLPNPYGELPPGETIMPIQPDAEKILFGRNSYMKKVIEDCQATEEGGKLLQYCCWENPHFSRVVLNELLWQIAFAYCHEMRHHIDLLLAVVTMEDSWQTHRLHDALKGVPEEREGLFDTIQASKNQYQKRAYQCIKGLVALFSDCRPAHQLLNSNIEFKQKWTLAIEWLQDELERRPYGSNGQYAFNTSWSTPAPSNETANGFFLERSASAKKTLEKALELCPDDDQIIDEGQYEMESCSNDDSGGFTSEMYRTNSQIGRKKCLVLNETSEGVKESDENMKGDSIEQWRDRQERMFNYQPPQLSSMRTSMSRAQLATSTSTGSIDPVIGGGPAQDLTPSPSSGVQPPPTNGTPQDS